MIRFQDLTLGYDRHPAVHHLNASINKGDFLALVGPNGAGKSTLMKSILGQLKPLEGSIHFDGVDLNSISYLPQMSQIDRTFPLTAEQLVSTGLWQERGPFGKINKSHKEKITHALDQVGLSGFEKRSIDALSGGQFQRVLFARKIVQSAKLLLLDEPFTGVDEQTIEDLMAVLKSLHKNGATIVAVIHNLELVARYFPTTLLLSRELIDMGETSKVLTQENLQKARTRGFGYDFDADVCKVHDHA